MAIIDLNITFYAFKFGFFWPLRCIRFRSWDLLDILFICQPGLLFFRTKLSYGPVSLVNFGNYKIKVEVIS